ncbi:MAG: ABC transporter permease [Oscillospiraceae bacterium]|nr:ABC transporter permease [Oscillospiraceae bacterium]MBQ2792090.1 ABC transporter permease [Oscillospiraceae bacterium]MBQ3241813.1 ABC transporter permease [Oscillospiraceae bacterium]
MLAIFKREFNSYFTSPIGYVFIAMFYFISGIFFFLYNLAAASAELRYVYSMLFTCSALLMPILTMRMLSEDKRQKTDQILLTSPVSLTGLLMGKFLAAFLVYVIAVSITLVYALVLSVFVSFNWAVIVSSYVGILLLGAALIAVGMFISSLTESQLVAAIVTVVVDLGLLLVDSLASVMPNTTLQNAVLSLSMSDRYGNFTMGILDFADTFFFLSVIALFIFLTGRVLEKRRWG